ncbi:AraC family transcriptional regulator [Tetragenococcus solitarius]|uniref:AraC family transcriptional regulator n=1 Tax=Tetragenococcus solitarius TaxID=71453 RepID=A0ABP6KQU7_9ENTE|nr:AraC family transcriptional regulator [Tetragenococcus solitarius]
MEYIDIIEKSLQYIEKHIESDIKISDIAKNVGYSPYHFSRLFSEKTGITIGAYIKNKKLSIASSQLLDTDKRIVDISITAGYTSYEAFSRVFKAHYGMAPYFYRKTKTKYYTLSDLPIDQQLLTHLEQHLSFIPEIINIKSIEVLGVSVAVNLLNNHLETYWQQFNNVMSALLPKEKTKTYAICTSQSSTVDSHGRSSFSQFLSFENKDCSINISQLFQQDMIDGGKYAVFKHNAFPSSLNLSYDFIWKVWSHASKYTFDKKRRSFEFYPENYSNKKVCPIYIYVPII